MLAEVLGKLIGEGESSPGGKGFFKILTTPFRVVSKSPLRRIVTRTRRSQAATKLP